MLKFNTFHRFQDPWKRAVQWNRMNNPSNLNGADDEEEIDEDILEEADQIGIDFDTLDAKELRLGKDGATKMGEKMGGKTNFNRSKLIKAANKTAKSFKNATDAGETIYKGKLNKLTSPEDIRHRASLLKAVDKYAKAKRIDMKDLVAKIKDCKNKSALAECENEMKDLAYKSYEQRLNRSGLYTALPGFEKEEQGLLNAEKKQLLDYFRSQPLDSNKKEGGDSMVDWLIRLKKDMEPKMTHRNKLRQQSKLVQTVYFAQLKNLSFTGSKVDLLKDIIQNLKGLEKEPSAIQSEFIKRQEVESKKEGSEQKKPAELIAEIKKEYESRVGNYREGILKNIKLFGGKMLKKPFFGPKSKQVEIRASAWEYLEWFSEQKTFIAMDKAQEKFAEELKKRTEVYSKRDELLALIPEPQQSSIRARTDEMRLHKLKPYIQDMESLVKKNGMHALEYIATLETAEDKQGHPLFTPEEVSQKSKSIRRQDPEVQIAELTLLQKKTIPKLEKLHAEYFDLPKHLQKPERFLLMGPAGKENLLKRALLQKQKEAENPWNIGEIDADGEELEVLALKNIQSDVGAAILEETFKDQEEFEGLEIQQMYQRKSANTLADAEKEGISATANILRDLSYWSSRGANTQEYEGAFKNKDKMSEGKHQQGYAAGYINDYIGMLAEEHVGSGPQIRSIGGHTRRLQKIKGGDLRDINKLKTVKNKLKFARYGTDTIMMEDERDIDADPDQAIESMLKASIDMHVALIKSMAKTLGLSRKMMTKKVVDALLKEILGKNLGTMAETHEDLRSVNNMDHFEDEIHDEIQKTLAA